MKKEEMTKVEAYLRKTFANNDISVRPRVKKDDSAEVFIKEDFIAVLFKDEEENDGSFMFEMAILAEDL